MSIRIEIGERYVVTSDSFQFILHEKKRAESGKNAGQEWLAVVGYYPKLGVVRQRGRGGEIGRAQVTL